MAEQNSQRPVEAAKSKAAIDAAVKKPAPSGDSPKPHGDKLEDAVHHAAEQTGKRG